VAEMQGDPARAARLYGAAEALWTRVSIAPDPGSRAQVERHLAAARVRLDEAAWSAAWGEGRAMSSEQAIAYALEEDVPA
jgi:hypothetical protein